MAQESSDTPRGLSLGRLFGGDSVLWIIVTALAVMSLLVVYSSTASMAYSKAGGDTTRFVFSQFTHICMGFALMVLIHRINYQVYYKWIMPAFLVSLAFMALTFVMGVNLNSAARWIRIPIVGLTFQPSDAVRVALVALLARALAVRQSKIDKMRLLPSFSIADWRKHYEKNRDILLGTTLPLLLPVVVSCGLIFFSNFSTAAITFLTCWIMLYIGRVKMSELFRLLVIIGVVLVLAVSLMAVTGVGRANTWVNRIESYAGIGEADEGDPADNLQREQAQIAIATGGIIGKGPGNSTQRSNLPHSYSDFAYAFIVEEYGLAGAAGVLLLYLWIFFRAILIFEKCGTAFPSLLVLGLSLMITMQALVNMMVSVGIFPVTGQTLPLISLGGSSLLFNGIALGMILGVSRQVKEQSFDRPRGESLLERG